jgi:gliding motility-associated lipoprotein GldH
MRRNKKGKGRSKGEKENHRNESQINSQETLLTLPRLRQNRIRTDETTGLAVTVAIQTTTVTRGNQTIAKDQIKIKAMKRAANLLLMLILFLVCSCSRNVAFSEYKKFDQNEWRVSDKAAFDFEMNDDQSLYNISLMVRHTDAYPYNNLFLFVTTKYPDGKVLKDTMELILASDKGKWHGSGAGDIFDYKVPVKQNVRFPLKGKYRFEFEQAMRINPLPEVMDFGMEIGKAGE